MGFYLALIGKEIICYCVKHNYLPNTKKSQMIIDRPIKVTFKDKSQKRTGKPCHAYINSEVKLIDKSKSIYVTIKSDDVEEIKSNLKNKFLQEYNILFNGEIYGKKLIGECSTYKEHKAPRWSACHGGQKVHMGCNIFSLCYVEMPHAMANQKFALK